MTKEKVFASLQLIISGYTTNRNIETLQEYPWKIQVHVQIYVVGKVHEKRPKHIFFKINYAEITSQTYKMTYLFGLMRISRRRDKQHICIFYASVKSRYSIVSKIKLIRYAERFPDMQITSVWCVFVYISLQTLNWVLCFHKFGAKFAPFTAANGWQTRNYISVFFSFKKLLLLVIAS